VCFHSSERVASLLVKRVLRMSVLLIIRRSWVLVPSGAPVVLARRLDVLVVLGRHRAIFLSTKEVCPKLGIVQCQILGAEWERPDAAGSGGKPSLCPARSPWRVGTLWSSGLARLRAQFASRSSASPAFSFGASSSARGHSRNARSRDSVREAEHQAVGLSLLI
jgi:hypothetical protein